MEEPVPNFSSIAQKHISLKNSLWKTYLVDYFVKWILNDIWSIVDVKNKKHELFIFLEYIFHDFVGYIRGYFGLSYIFSVIKNKEDY